MDGKIQQQTADFIGLSHFEVAPKTLPFKSLTSAAAL
jgi:hypothetical protein